MAENCPELILADLYLKDGKGTDLLKAEKGTCSFPMVVMVDCGSGQDAAEAIMAGALEYLVKSEIGDEDLPLVVGRVLREWSHIMARKHIEKELFQCGERSGKAAGSNGDKNPSSLRILVAEDEVINRIVLEDPLKEAGHKVCGAKNGEKVMEVFKNEEFDLILMDIRMPVMDGIEATRAIRTREKETGSHIPIIAITAYALEEDIDRFIRSGMDDCLVKPIDFDELNEIIERSFSAPR